MTDTAATPLSAIHEILKWAPTCPEWQQDALRRIFQTNELGKEDLAQLAGR
jgi:hypothetical protein